MSFNSQPLGGSTKLLFRLNICDVKGASLVAQMVKNPPAMHETWVQSLDWEDPLEKGMATHSCLENPPSGLQSMGLQSRTRRSD